MLGRHGPLRSFWSSEVNRLCGRTLALLAQGALLSMSSRLLAQDTGAPPTSPEPAASRRAAPAPAASGPPSVPTAATPPPPSAEAAAAEPVIDQLLSDELEPNLDPDGDLAEVTVTVSRNEAQRLRESADAVTVVDTKKAQRQTADLGEVLARTQGIAIRRSGGLGSDARFSLNGLCDDQIRFFLDGVPLDVAGFPFGITNVPVNLIDRVEVYRGVVPVRFGTDALGGAINLVTDRSYETHVGVSYQVGSFGTHRVTLDGRYRHEPTGLIVGGAAFLDAAENDYDIDVEVADAQGRLSPATVPRFHDGYVAYGVTLEVGVVDQPWAKRLTLQGFLSTYDKELQHNVVMTVPYGEVDYGETVYGATARYDVALGPSLDLELIANYARRTIDFVDKAQWVYDWFGARIRERRVLGEIESDPTDQTTWQDSGLARATLTAALAPGHILRLSLSPNYVTRTGDERIQADPAARDPLTAQRDLLTVVSGLEYELSALGDRLSNILFVKDYVYRAMSEEALPGNLFRKRDTDSHTFGVGDAFRFQLLPWLYAKVSYEYATRLPRPDEVFGDGVLVLANLELEREVSHNANLGPRIEYRDDTTGTFTLDVNGFLRQSDRLVVLLGSGDRFSSYQNVYAARSLGIENAATWDMPGRFFGVEGTLTWQDVRNASDSGTFGAFDGDRIPNRPYLFASWGAHLRFSGMPAAQDTLEPFYAGRYVHGFFRGWESQGLRQFKQVVDTQVTHAAGVSWNLERYPYRGSATLEVDNFTDAKIFDNFGVQRPGRAYYLKLTGEM
jgi:vitamin B12 transporter